MQHSLVEYNLKEDEQLCYIHVPKTAGTTLTSLLDANFDQQDICPAAVWSELTQIPPEELEKYRLLRGHFYYYIHKFLPKKPLYITMMRDPIERIISAYEFMKRFRPSREEGIQTHEKALTLSLKEYVCDPEVSGIVNAQTRHFTPNLYRKFPDLTDPAWLEAAKENLAEFAFVGVTEKFQNSMELLTYTFGWKPLVQYQNLMVAPKKTRREDLAQDVIDAIAERNQLDIALYEYAQGIFEARYAQMLQRLQEEFSTVPEVQERLERHYEQRYADLNLPAQEFLTFRFDQALSGSGWHLREGLGESKTAFRWTGPGTISTLDLPIASNNDLMIEIRVASTVAPDVLESLKLFVNQHPIPLVSLYHDESEVDFVFQGEVPKSILVNDKPFAQLAFHVNRTLSPQSVNPENPDTRPVGLALNLLQVFPIRARNEASLFSFMFNCESWKTPIAFIRQHLKAGDRVFAPKVFSLELADVMGQQDSTVESRKYNYSSSFLAKSDYQWVIVHKAMKREIGSLLKKLLLWQYHPVFANEVFIIFSSHSDLPKLPHTFPHVKSLYGGYFKYYVQQHVNLINKSLKSFGNSMKRQIKSFYKRDH